MKHECDARVLNVSTKKWRFKPKKNEYGYVNVKAKKIVCSGAKHGPVFDLPTHAEPVQADSTDSTHVQGRPTDVIYGEGVKRTMGHVGQVIVGQDYIEKENRA